MRKQASASAPIDNVMAVSVVSFGNDPIAVAIPVGSTVADALRAAGVSRGAAQLFVSGEVAEDNDVLEAGDVLSIVTSKQAGS